MTREIVGEIGRTAVLCSGRRFDGTLWTALGGVNGSHPQPESGNPSEPRFPRSVDLPRCVRRATRWSELQSSNTISHPGAQEKLRHTRGSDRPFSVTAPIVRMGYRDSRSSCAALGARRKPRSRPDSSLTLVCWPISARSPRCSRSGSAHLIPSGRSEK